MHRDGLALVLSSALTSAVGLLYWVLVARLFTPEVAGVNSAALATLSMLGGIAHLNMQNALLRFVPVAGPRAPRLVAGAYAAAIGSAVIVGALFALGAPVWAPDMVAVAGLGALVVFFAVGTPLMAMFDVQDNLLTALGRAVAVPVENLLFALLKAGLLVLAAVVVVPGGIAVSWVLATAVAVLVISVWVFAVLLPRHAAKTGVVETITVAGIARFAGTDYAGSVFWQFAIYGLPLLVLERLGAAFAATYQIVWTMAMALYLVVIGMTQSMVAHGAGDPGGAEQARRATSRRALMLTAPAVAILTVGAYPILSIFGPYYAATGTGALALCALSALPNIVTQSVLSTARVQRNMAALFAIPTAIALIVIVLSWALAPLWGLTAVGAAWLVGQSAVAAWLLVGRRTAAPATEPRASSASTP